MSAYPLYGRTNAFNLKYDKVIEKLTQHLLYVCRLIKYNKEEYARIGVMPRYGDANSIKWFEVEPNCTFHIINSFEDGHEASYLELEVIVLVIQKISKNFSDI